MRLFRQGWEILTEEGIGTFSRKFIRFGYNSILQKINIICYGWLARVRSPIEYHGVFIPTEHDVFDRNVRSRFLRNKYESQEITAIDRHINHNADIIDIGASTGFLTVYLLNNCNPEARAIAVEANPELIPLLEEVRNINDVQFNIEEAAYHSSNDRVEFNIHPLTVGGSVQRDTKNTVTISSISLESIVQKYGIKQCVCIVDIEGGEADLISNELSILEEYCQILIIEFHEGYTAGIPEAKEALESSRFNMIDEIDAVRVYENQGVE
jgi:FkbM family methyltransferase